jgi:hypothetical protein
MERAVRVVAKRVMTGSGPAFRSGILGPIADGWKQPGA